MAEEHRQNRQWRLARRPTTTLDDEVLRLETEPVPKPGEGQVLVRNLLLSLDPTHRIWMSDMKQYLPPVEIGAVMRAGTIGQVVESAHPGFRPGEIVAGMGGYQDYQLARGEELTRLPWDGRTPLSTYMGLLSFIGVTAYQGMLEIGDPQPGETVVVSGAAGAVGSIAGQLAKIRGARVIGIAGGPAKCAWLTGELGFDAAIDYRAENVRARLRELAPKGVNVYFDNVGGEITEAVFDNLALNARIPLCGLISTYNSGKTGTGPRNYANVLMQRAMIKGFIVIDAMPRAARIYGELAKWHAEGRIKYRVDVRSGLENAPTALRALFDGSNEGKLVIEIGVPSAAA
jgi:NADPH-dependent curcumin reductase CurA